MLSLLLLPFGVGIITRLALRPRGQGQQNPLTINVPLWMLVMGWVLSVLLALLGLAEPTDGNFSVAFTVVIGAGITGALIPELFMGLGRATTNLFSRWQGWLGLIGVGVAFYGLFIDPLVFQVVFQGGLIFGLFWLSYRMILGLVKPPKKKGGN